MLCVYGASHREGCAWWQPFETEKYQFETEKSQFETEKSQFEYIVVTFHLSHVVPHTSYTAGSGSGSLPESSTLEYASKYSG